MSTNFFDDIKNIEDWVSLAEAARIRNVSRQAISKLVKKGKLKSMVIGGHVLVSKKQVINFKPQKSGRPKKIR